MIGNPSAFGFVFAATRMSCPSHPSTLPTSAAVSTSRGMDLISSSVTNYHPYLLQAQRLSICEPIRRKTTGKTRHAFAVLPTPVLVLPKAERKDANSAFPYPLFHPLSKFISSEPRFDYTTQVHHLSSDFQKKFITLPFFHIYNIFEISYNGLEKEGSGCLPIFRALHSRYQKN